MASMNDRMSIEELATAAGLTRRAVRFYVQHKLLPAPFGLGRGKHYDNTHLDRLKRLQELQTAGYSLDAIRQILDGGKVATPAASPRHRATKSGSVELWTRFKVAPGIELHLDLKRFNSDVEKLLSAGALLKTVFGLGDTESNGEP
jgi:DNA-binding transcriptional MerR regulator